MPRAKAPRSELVQLIESRLAAAPTSLRSTHLRSILGIDDRFVAARLFAVLGGVGGRLKKTDLVERIGAIVDGSEETKLRFLFDLHDANRDGFISRPELLRMLEASFRQNDLEIGLREKQALARSIIKRGASAGKRRLDFADFKRLLRQFPAVFKDMIANIGEWFTGQRREGQTKGRWHWRAALAFIFVTIPRTVYRYLLVLAYIGLNVYLFWDAFTHYASLGASIYVQIARGAGAILNLHGALILIPMMRGLLGILRRTPFGSLLLVDHHIEIHRLFGEVLVAFGLIHTAAHVLNYLTLDRPLTDSLFHTTAGLTGVVALGALLLMWLFARKAIRRSGRFELFFISHALYGVFFAALYFHAPNFWKWATIPLVFFAIEYIVQRTRKRHVSFIEEAEVLPGQVVALRLHRPEDFAYQPGDYLYLKIPKISRFEWHPFTISSHPEDAKHLTLHIRAVGNWTKALLKAVEAAGKGKWRNLPVAITGPYGTPSNRIYRSRQAILIGAGIGVTPFSSILQSVLHRHLEKSPLKLEKVHFFWLNRGQSSFDWFGDLLDKIESRAKRGFFSINIYLTNASVGATSGLLRIGMEVLHKETKTDVATGLASVTHFGRPDWGAIFAKLSKDRGLGTMDVFFCGPAELAKSVRTAARRFGFRFRKENF